MTIRIPAAAYAAIRTVTRHVYGRLAVVRCLGEGGRILDGCEWHCRAHDADIVYRTVMDDLLSHPGCLGVTATSGEGGTVTEEMLNA